MSSVGRWVLTHTELAVAVHGLSLQFELNGFSLRDWLVIVFVLACQPFNASVTTYDGELSRNSAYFVKFARASSSSRSWIGVVFGCLIGAFRTAIEILSFRCSGLFALCIRVRLLLRMHAGKTRHRAAPAHPRVLAARICHLLPSRMYRSLKSLDWLRK